MPSMALRTVRALVAAVAAAAAKQVTPGAAPWLTACDGQDAACNDALLLLQVGATGKNWAQRIAANQSSVSSSVSRALVPPMPKDLPPMCRDRKVVDFWRSEDLRASEAISAWRAQVPDGSILKEKKVNGVDASCTAEGPLVPPIPGVGPHVLNLVKDLDEELCGEGEPDTSTRVDFAFNVTWGRMAERSPTRNVSILWPGSGTCSQETPCPVILYFRGCGGEEPYLTYSSRCLADLGSVLVFPGLAQDEDGTTEAWTDPENDALESYVLPLIRAMRVSYSGLLDFDRMAVAGSSMGSGMALLSALRYPNLFSASLAVGLTDGIGCNFASFQPTVFNVAAAAAAAVPDSDWRLNLVVIAMGESEDVLPLSTPWRLSAALELLRNGNVTSRSAIHVRLLKGLDHGRTIAATWRHWKGLYKYLWRGFLGA